MPRNRRPRDREEKRAEIVAAARQLFIQEGYESTSMARIANEAGVVSNTVYWYFTDKDAVLVAVLDHVLTDALDRFGHVRSLTSAERLAWVVTELKHTSRLVTTVHARSRESESVREWHERFHDLTDQLLRAEFTELGVPDDQVEPMSMIAVFVLEGLLTHPGDEHSQRAVIDTLLRSARGSAMTRAVE